MKKFVCILLLCVLFLSAPVFAVGDGAYEFTLLTPDMSGNVYQVFLMSCDGLYDPATDSVTAYITNTSKKTADFQLSVGFSGDKVQTAIDSGFVALSPGTTGKFTLTNLKDIPEKANDDLGYVPNSALSGNSVIRIRVNDAYEGMTFVLSGINYFAEARNTSFKEISYGAYVQVPLNAKYISDAREVIQDESDKPEEKFGWTLTQPPAALIDKFTIFVVASAILCVGGIIIYTISFISRRRKKHDRKTEI